MHVQKHTPDTVEKYEDDVINLNIIRLKNIFNMKSKANIGIALVITFAVTLITGIILHLKSHVILVQPRDVLKVVHWSFGYAMTVLLCIHWSEFHKMLSGMKKKFVWFYADTWLLITLFIATLLTGTVKLISPIKIPHLGLWHYGIGIAMSITALIHLVRGLPSWNRLRKCGR